MTWREGLTMALKLAGFGVFFCFALLLGRHSRRLNRNDKSLIDHARALDGIIKRCEVSESEVIRLVKNKANWVALLIAVRRCEQQLGLPRTELHVPIQRTEGSNDIDRDSKPVAAICERCGLLATITDIESGSQVDRFWCPQCQALTMKDIREGEGKLCS